eukprot:2515197-Rhodomonas_salina.1
MLLRPLSPGGMCVSQLPLPHPLPLHPLFPPSIPAYPHCDLCSDSAVRQLKRWDGPGNRYRDAGRLSGRARVRALAHYANGRTPTTCQASNGEETGVEGGAETGVEGGEAEKSGARGATHDAASRQLFTPARLQSCALIRFELSCERCKLLAQEERGGHGAERAR